MAFVVGPSRNPTVALAFELLEGGSKSPKLAHAKDDLVVSEPYRRLVAALPCINCGISGYSQAAHVPPVGKQIKQSDLDTFPLCCTRQQEIGCHVRFDNYKLFPRAKAVTQGAKWAAATRVTIAKAGSWPKKLAAYMPKVKAKK